MEKFTCTLALLFVVLATCADRAAAQEECSTEKVNNTCTVTVDRSYPIAVPTIQLRPGQKLKVRVVHPVPFETLSLDLQSGQTLAGTDQTAGFVTAALPNLKGLLLQTKTNLVVSSLIQSDPSLKTQVSDSPDVTKVKKDILQLNLDMLSLFLDIDVFVKRSVTVYAQINEVLGSISPILFQPDKPSRPGEPPAFRRLPGSSVSNDFPHPWIDSEYDVWRKSMLCELASQECPAKADPSIRGLLGDGVKITTALAPCPTTAQPRLISCQITTLQTDVASIADQAQRDSFSNFLQQLNVDSSVLNADSAAISAINKDLGNYLVNIALSKSAPPPDPLGEIIDPRDDTSKINVQLKKFLGRQVVLAINAVNEVAISAASVTTAAQKKPVVTITVLYADPIFEVSTGTLISTLPSRSIANQTIVTQNPGSSPTLGNIVIAQTISRPTVVVFAGANWRLGHDFLWLDQRRGAFYFTTTVGLNVNNTAAEFGVGPSISWRSLMFSTLYDWGHDVRLTQGEFVGMVWCNVSAANGSIPKCSGNPPTPSTEKYWRSAFAFGISVRVPTVFTGGH